MSTWFIDGQSPAPGAQPTLLRHFGFPFWQPQKNTSLRVIPFWHSFWHYIWHILRHCNLHSIWHSISHSMWHSIWHSISHLTFYLAFYLAFYLTYILTFYLTYILTFYLASIWQVGKNIWLVFFFWGDTIKLKQWILLQTSQVCVNIFSASATRQLSGGCRRDIEQRFQSCFLTLWTCEDSGPVRCTVGIWICAMFMSCPFPGLWMTVTDDEAMANPHFAHQNREV